MSGTERENPNNSVDGRRTESPGEELQYDLDNKPLILNPVNGEEAAEVFNRYALFEDKRWSRRQCNAAANCLYGRPIVIDDSQPDANLLNISARMEEELPRNEYLMEVMDPQLLIIHTLPHQSANWTGVAPDKTFQYPTWGAHASHPPYQVHIPAISADRNNAPLVWNAKQGGILFLANESILRQQGRAPPLPAVGDEGCAFSFLSTASNPFLLVFPDVIAVRYFLNYITGDFHRRFGAGNIDGFSYDYFAFTNNLTERNG